MSLLRTLIVALLFVSAARAQGSSVCLSASDNAFYDNGTGMGGPLLFAVLLQAPAPLSVTRLEVWTGEQVGTNTLGLWSHDATLNLPGTNLGTGSWSMGQVNGWQGARVPSIQVPAGLFWLVWGPVREAQASVERTGTPASPAPGAQFYRASFDGGSTWNGGGPGFRTHLWKLRIFCGGSPGTYEVYGSNCRGTGVLRPILGFSDVPSLGRTMEINLVGAPPVTTAYLAIGHSDASWLGLALPLDLGPFGAPNCTLLCSALDFIVVQTTGGTAGVALTVPVDPALLGAPVFNQWWVLHPTATALGFVFSNGGRGVIGN